MPITLRDSTNNVAFVPLGNGLPKYHWGMSQNIEYKRFSVYGLLDASVGQKLWNIAYHWSLGDFQSEEIDQSGKSVETRSRSDTTGAAVRPPPPAATPASAGSTMRSVRARYSVEDASYVKLREVTVNYRVGAVGGAGDWKVGRRRPEPEDVDGFPRLRSGSWQHHGSAQLVGADAGRRISVPEPAHATRSSCRPRSSKTQTTGGRVASMAARPRHSCLVRHLMFQKLQ